MKQFFKKSLLQFVALSATIHSRRVAYFHLDTVLFIFIVLYLCFCMSYANIELFTQWNKKTILNNFRPVSGVSVFLNFKTCVWHIFEQIHTFCFHTKQPRVLCFISLNCVFVCVCYCARQHWQAFGWYVRNRLSECMCVCVSSVERQQLRLGTYTTGVHCICGHMMPIRQIRAQTDEALLNGSFY